MLRIDEMKIRNIEADVIIGDVEYRDVQKHYCYYHNDDSMGLSYDDLIELANLLFKLNKELVSNKKGGKK